MQKTLIREMAIYAILLVVLALMMHPDLLFNPTERISLMQERKNYFHPLIYTFILYSLFFFIRLVVKKTVILFRKIRDK